MASAALSTGLFGDHSSQSGHKPAYADSKLECHRANSVACKNTSKHHAIGAVIAVNDKRSLRMCFLSHKNAHTRADGRERKEAEEAENAGKVLCWLVANLYQASGGLSCSSWCIIIWSTQLTWATPRWSSAKVIASFVFWSLFLGSQSSHCGQRPKGIEEKKKDREKTVGEKCLSESRRKKRQWCAWVFACIAKRRSECLSRRWRNEIWSCGALISWAHQQHQGTEWSYCSNKQKSQCGFYSKHKVEKMW